MQPEKKVIRTILFAEDDNDDYSFVEDAIKAINPSCGVLEAKDGKQTLQLLQSLPDHQLPDLIILDYNMPQMDGLATLQSIKADTRYSTIPIIMYSNTNYSGYINNCLSSGAEAFITKGATLLQIKEDIHTMLSYCG